MENRRRGGERKTETEPERYRDRESVGGKGCYNTVNWRSRWTSCLIKSYRGQWGTPQPHKIRPVTENTATYHPVLGLIIVAISAINPCRKSRMLFAWWMPVLRTSSWSGPFSAAAIGSDEFSRCVELLEASSLLMRQTLVTRESEKHRMLHCRATVTSGAVLIPDTTILHVRSRSTKSQRRTVGNITWKHWRDNLMNYRSWNLNISSTPICLSYIDY